MKTSTKAAVIALLLLGITGRAAWAQSGAIYELKHRSAFSEQPARNPFCPIGWVKGVEAIQSVQEAAAPLVTADSFVVTGISISPTPLALINGKACEEGETIEAKSGGQILKIKVLRINDGSVVLQYQNKTYTVALKQPKLSSESAPKELPPENPPMTLH